MFLFISYLIVTQPLYLFVIVFSSQVRKVRKAIAKKPAHIKTKANMGFLKPVCNEVQKVNKYAPHVRLQL